MADADQEPNQSIDPAFVGPNQSVGVPACVGAEPREPNEAVHALASSSAASNADSSGGPVSSPNVPGGDFNRLSNASNDAIGVALAGCGLVPGPVGVACGIAGEVQNETLARPDPADASYKDDKAVQNLNRGLAAAGVADALGVPGMSAAGPLGVVAAGGVALGHGAQAIGTEMIEQGIDKNPGQFGDDPMNSIR